MEKTLVDFHNTHKEDMSCDPSEMDKLMNNVFQLQEKFMQISLLDFSAIADKDVNYCKYKGMRDYWDNKLKGLALMVISRFQVEFLQLAANHENKIDENIMILIGAAFHDAQTIINSIENILNDTLFTLFPQTDMFIDLNETEQSESTQKRIESLNALLQDYMELHKDMVKVVGLFRYISQTVNQYLLQNNNMTLQDCLNKHFSHFENEKGSTNFKAGYATAEHITLSKFYLDLKEQRGKLPQNPKIQNETSS